jgi:putative transposase
VLYPFHRRNLPHIIPTAIPIFFTWRLYGSLPANKSFCRDGATGTEFRLADRNLAMCASGPKWLRDPQVASMVAEEIKATAHRFQRYRLLEFVVMPNHVHLLVVPYGEPSEILRVLKGYTARLANKILGRTGSPFWQDETFDHYVRHVEHQTKIRNYIVNDPVKCGLVTRSQDYKWSSGFVQNGRKVGIEPT